MFVAVTYPGYVPFDRIRPFVLGMPFSLFWQLIWICGAVLVLAGLFLWEKRRRDLAHRASGRPGTDDPGGD